MRLFQLARKLNVKQESIVAVLAENGIEIENKSNTKLEEDHVEMVMEHFTPADPTSNEEDTVQESVDEEPTIIEENKVEVSEEEPTVPIERALPQDDDESEPHEEDSETEVIRVKKIKLSGPKVVGKIELPEPKPKPDQPEKDEQTEKKEKSRYQQRDRRRGKRPSRRRESLEQKRKREEREKARLKKEQEKLKKQKRTEYYKKNVQATPEERKPKFKKKKTVNKAQIIETPAQHRKVETHKNPLKRFWAWLNGEYDRY